ncbi:hypothetical protein PF005_g20816 [Phytophthora fragariae]|uniref:Uncharacterized protein n=2 Tax=Phytophthora TaxID=4783 RepID=A0A6A3E6G0_9STRA|nr:hypothetical protein PF003_g10027 [Phytophthora fragariae]KAE9001665.1 hypothetical protein PR002_g17852 [Phytophthora rubi]KAE8928023.1 hypothetical protein PF009_g21823 [Phytophthora fragariae]KAE8987334.1 hypothetical protein PF011_g19621 [Phytophthora fragariae]KAE9004829.1 hypothetical protein PR001_g17613 [Phytophthora rubi]
MYSVRTVLLVTTNVPLASSSTVSGWSEGVAVMLTTEVSYFRVRRNGYVVTSAVMRSPNQ